MSVIARTAPWTSHMDTAREQLDEVGYCVVPGVLSPAEIAALKARLVEQAEGERAAGVAFHDGGPSRPNQRVWMLLNKGRVFRDLEDFNTQLAAWQIEVADVRVHGTTHQRPIDRFADEARALMPTASHASFLQAMVRDRVVADDWLVSIDGNRYSVPFVLIGKTVQVVREGGSWVIRHRGAVVAEHAVLAGRAQLSVRPEHGPGAAARNARQRYSAPRASAATEASREVEVRDLAVYERLIGNELVEVVA